MKKKNTSKSAKIILANVYTIKILAPLLMITPTSSGGGRPNIRNITVAENLMPRCGDEIRAIIVIPMISE